MGGAAEGARREGETLADFYERFGRGKEVPEPPEIPDAGAHVLAWFFDLSKRRAPAMSGVAAIQFGDIAAWRDLLQIDVRPDEIGLILALDDAYRGAVADEQKEGKEKAVDELPIHALKAD